VIFLNVADKVLRKIELCKTAAEAWETLDRLFMIRSLPHRVYTQLSFYTFKMQENKKIDENIDDFLKIVADLNHLQIDVTDEVQAILLLSSLPARYDGLVETMKYNNSREKLRLDDVMVAARDKERELSQNNRPVAEGHFARGRPDGKNNNQGNKGKNRSRSKSADGKRVCWICGKEGHFKKQCYKWIERNKSKQQGSDNGESSLAKSTEGFNPAMVLMATDETLVVTDSIANEWVLDTGCSFHMTPRKDWFKDFKELSSGYVKMGNDTYSPVKGIGSIKIRNSDGSQVILTDVRYMPNMTRNLISLGTLEDRGCWFKSQDGILKIVKGCSTILKGQKRDTLYILDGVTEEGESHSSAEVKDETALWHSRLGHMSQKGMEILVKKGCLRREVIKELEFCEDCVYGKQHRVSFAPAQHVTKEKLAYVHSDLWGSPHNPASLGNSQYFISFVDDYSRKVWIYFLRKKDEAFEKFVEWKKMVENQSDRKVKKLRTDNGLEYCNHYFEKFCKEEGIVRHKTCAYTPQQNGIAERLNRTIMDKVRSMLSESGMEKKFWAEAASTAVYLINRSPSTAINLDLPEEKWTGALPDLSSLRKFGCLAYIHADQGKLNPRSKKGIFTSYPEGVKGYKVWVLEDKKCVISRNVIFREHVMFKDLKGDSQNTISESDLEDLRVNPDMNDQKFTYQGGATQDNSNPSEAATSHNPVLNSPTHSQDQEESEEEDSDAVEDLSTYQLVRDRVRRTIKANPKYNESNMVGFAYYSEDDGKPEPKSYQEALLDPDWEKWNAAMKEEMVSMSKNHTWDLVTKPEKVKLIGCRWVFTRKAGIPGVEAPRFKARLVAKGFTQKEGVDYNEIFSPVVKHVSIRYLLSMVVHYNMELQQMDVKTAFLHGFLEEEIYMAQPEGFEIKRGSDKVCLLKRSLYGLKQSPRQWNLRFDEFMRGIKYTRSAYDSCVYFKKCNGDTYIYLLLYVDDMLIASVNKSEVNELKQLLSREFEMKDLGDAKKILGMEISRDRGAGLLTLSQEGYVKKVLRSFQMDNAKPVSTPLGIHFKLKAATDKEYEEQFERMKIVPYANTIGSIMYSMIGTRPDLAYSLGVISRFMSKPFKDHWQAVKWVLRYMRGTEKKKLCFRKQEDFLLRGYCDSDYGSNFDTRRSITGYVFTVGGNTISWKSKLQKVVAISSTEAEYMALTEAVKEAL